VAQPSVRLRVLSSLTVAAVSRCRRVDTCTLLDSFLVSRSFRPVDSEIRRCWTCSSCWFSELGVPHPAVLARSPACGELLVQIRRGLRPLINGMLQEARTRNWREQIAPVGWFIVKPSLSPLMAFAYCMMMEH
jgi:hypothetical protein